MDVRGYINPLVPGALSEGGQRAGMTGEIYVEDRKGKQIDALIASVRKGTIVQVAELFYLAPATGRPQKRRRILGERVDAILERGGRIQEIIGGRTSMAAIRLTAANRAYEQIATSGRARKHNRPGRPLTWDLTKAEWEVAEGLWTSRKFQNDSERTVAIQSRLGKKITRATLRRRLGSPHGR